MRRRRAAAIAEISGSFAYLFAALTLAWIAVDAIVFPAPLWQLLADRRMYAAKQAGRNRCVADDAGTPIEILAPEAT